jgi:hypothetical protein
MAMSTGTLIRSKSLAGGPGRSISLIFDGTKVKLPANALDLEGFRAWTLSDDFPEEGRIAFINGEVFVDVSREEITVHLLLKSQIGAVPRPSAMVGFVRASSIVSFVSLVRRIVSVFGPIGCTFVSDKPARRNRGVGWRPAHWREQSLVSCRSAILFVALECNGGCIVT